MYQQAPQDYNKQGQAPPFGQYPTQPHNPGHYQDPSQPQNPHFQAQPQYYGGPQQGHNPFTQDPYSHPNGSPVNPVMPPPPTDSSDYTDMYATGGLSRKLGDNTRLGFIRKVMGILAAQFAFTAVGVALSLADQYSFQRFYTRNFWLLGVAIIGYMITLYALGCYRSVARAVPTNYIMLSIFTGCFTWMVMGVTTQYRPEIVVAAAVLTAAMVGALAIYALTTKNDFTICVGFMYAFFMVSITTLFLSFFIRSRVVELMISGLVVALMSLYIIIDLQLIIGNQSYALEIDDYIFAAMMLYIDIMRLFLEILKILGKK